MWTNGIFGCVFSRYPFVGLSSNFVQNSPENQGPITSRFLQFGPIPPPSRAVIWWKGAQYASNCKCVHWPASFKTAKCPFLLALLPPFSLLAGPLMAKTTSSLCCCHLLIANDCHFRHHCVGYERAHPSHISMTIEIGSFLGLDVHLLLMFLLFLMSARQCVTNGEEESTTWSYVRVLCLCLAVGGSSLTWGDGNTKSERGKRGEQSDSLTNERNL